jgi:hypothetical protein
VSTWGAENNSGQGERRIKICAWQESNNRHLSRFLIGFSQLILFAYYLSALPFAASPIRIMEKD